MRVGTDAVLLGAWVNINEATRILDIGTGCGVIALMLAQRAHDTALIDAVEIAPSDAGQADENVRNSPWPHKITIHKKAIQEFIPSYQYDLIVSNPPYFINSLLPPEQSRTGARHTKNLNFEELIDHAFRLLTPTGRLAIILPFAEGNLFKSTAYSKGLHLIRETAFHSRDTKPQERWLLEFSMCSESSISDRLVLYNSDGGKSDAYVKLTEDFYLA